MTVDDFLLVETYPTADTKQPLRGRHRQVGGLTATALVTTARLGCKTAYAGVLGEDELSRAVVKGLGQAGVDLSHAVPCAEAVPVYAFIVVAENPPTRTIMFEQTGLCGADPLLPSEDIIKSAGVLLVDNYGMPGMIRAARIARDHGIPVIGDFDFDDAPGFPDLLDLVDHLILSYNFAAKLVGPLEPAEMLTKLWKADRKIVSITRGIDGSWYMADPAVGVCHQPAFPVTTVDSTGCGDVFHGAYAATLLRGFDIPRRVEFAAAAAAIKATRPGGQTGIPTWDQVESFLRERR